MHERIARDLAGAGWSVCPGFLGEEEVGLLAREAAELWAAVELRPAGVGAGAERRVAPEIRSDHILWIEEPYTPGQRRYLDELERLRVAINRKLFLGLFDFEGHLAVYPPGARYRRHLDQFEREKRRVVSCILYLNADWEEEDGGELRLYLGKEEDAPHHDVLPAGGTLAIFLSADIPHEVLPARRERLSLTGWFRTRP